MSSAVAGCFLGANREHPLEAVIASTAAMGVCGELAYETGKPSVGSYRTLLIDAMDQLTEEHLAKRAKVQRIF